MHGISMHGMLILFTFVAHTHGVGVLDKLVEKFFGKLVDRLNDRVRNASPMHNAHLDNKMAWKCKRTTIPVPRSSTFSISWFSLPGCLKRQLRPVSDIITRRLGLREDDEIARQQKTEKKAKELKERKDKEWRERKQEKERKNEETKERKKNMRRRDEQPTNEQEEKISGNREKNNVEAIENVPWKKKRKTMLDSEESDTAVNFDYNVKKRALKTDHANQGEETGSFSNWDMEKGFGFIKPDDGGEQVFVHFSEVLDGRWNVKNGDQVTYKRHFNKEKGKYKAVQVRKTGSDGASGCDGENQRERTGIVVNWNTKKGFGFIKPNDGSNSLFCHMSEIMDMDGVTDGDRVTYVRQFDEEKGKYCAVEVQKAEGSRLKVQVVERSGDAGNAGGWWRSKKRNWQMVCNETGTLKNFDQAKGHGFITSHEDEKDLFFPCGRAPGVANFQSLCSSGRSTCERRAKESNKEADKKESAERARCF